MSKIDYENGEETKELNIKLFDFFYIPDDLESYEEVLVTIESLVQTKKDVVNLFGQVFESLNDDDLDILKIKKAFLVSNRLLGNSENGFKYFETVIANNYTQYYEFMEKHSNTMSAETEICNLFSELKGIIETYKGKIKEMPIEKPRMSVSLRKSVIKIEQDISQLIKEYEKEKIDNNLFSNNNSNSSSRKNSFLDPNQRKSLLEKFKAEYEKERRDDMSKINSDNSPDRKKSEEIQPNNSRINSEENTKEKEVSIDSQRASLIKKEQEISKSVDNQTRNSLFKKDIVISNEGENGKRTEILSTTEKIEISTYIDREPVLENNNSHDNILKDIETPIVVEKEDLNVVLCKIEDLTNKKEDNAVNVGEIIEVKSITQVRKSLFEKKFSLNSDVKENEIKLEGNNIHNKEPITGVLLNTSLEADKIKESDKENEIVVENIFKPDGETIQNIVEVKAAVEISQQMKNFHENEKASGLNEHETSATAPLKPKGNNSEDKEIKKVETSDKKSEPLINLATVKKPSITVDLINIDPILVKLDSNNQNLYNNNMDLNMIAMENIENTFSNNSKNTRRSKIELLTMKKLIDQSLYQEETENENINIIYNINKMTNEKEINFISLNLFLHYVISGKDKDKFKCDISRYFIAQHGGIISSENLAELFKSVLSITKTIPVGLIILLNEWVCNDYKGEIFDNQLVRENIISLYELISIKNKEIYFNTNNLVKVNEIIELLKSSQKDISIKRFRELAGENNKSFDNLNYYSESPIFPSVERSYFDILDWSETEIARQLTLITFHFFSNILPNELINSQWTKCDKYIYSPNVTKMIERFNKLSFWVCEEILSYDKAKYRAMVIEKFIQLAQKLKEIFNFNDCFNVITALNSFQIKSLSKSWRRISFEAVKIFKELTNFCSYNRNYGALRDEIEKCQGKPCIPYLGYFLKEIAFIEEGPKYIKEPNLINIDKIKRVAKILDSIKQFQNIHYTFKPVFQLAFLADTSPLSEDELTKLSGQLEPDFILNKNKSKTKRWSTTDLKFQYLTPNFNEFIGQLNVEKNSKSLKERIKMHFQKN